MGPLGSIRESILDRIQDSILLGMKTRGALKKYGRSKSDEGRVRVHL